VLIVMPPENSEVRETERRFVNTGCCHGSEGKWPKKLKKLSSKWLMTSNFRMEPE
jgi:hypothetical protein